MHAKDFRPTCVAEEVEPRHAAAHHAAHHRTGVYAHADLDGHALVGLDAAAKDKVEKQGCSCQLWGSCQ